MKPTRARNAMGAIAIAAAVLLVSQPGSARAGDKEWAAAGKILTGLVAARVIANSACAPSTSRYDVREVRYTAPAPRIVHETRVVKYQSPSRHNSWQHQPHYRSSSWHSPMRGRVFTRPSWYRESVQITVTPPCTTTYEVPATTHHGQSTSLYSDPRGLIITENAVIYQSNEWSRVYQPKIHDHPAYKQERSHGSGTWRTVGDHPSIW